jgi:hypothetical protein
MSVRFCLAALLALLFVPVEVRAQNLPPQFASGSMSALAPMGPAPYRPSAALAFGPYDLLSGFAPAYLTARQPIGHEIIPTSANGYVYQPVFADPPPPVQSPSLPPMNGNVLIGSTQPGAAPAAWPNVSPDRMQTAVASFQAGQYDVVVQQTVALLAADPRNGPAQLLQSHAWFALGKFPEATAALRQALATLPSSQWGMILDRYRDYYRSTRYTALLRALEQSIAIHPAQADLRLLVGYHYGYLGYPPAAASQLAEAARLAPSDETAQSLLQVFSVPANASSALTAPNAPAQNRPMPGPPAPLREF